MMSKRFVILGGGESGVGAALLAKKHGYEVFLSDKSSLKHELMERELLCLNFKDDSCKFEETQML